MRTATFLTLIVATWLGPRLCCCATARLLDSAPPPAKAAAPEKPCCCCEPTEEEQPKPADAPKDECPCCVQAHDWVAVAPDAVVSPPPIDTLSVDLPPVALPDRLLSSLVESSTRDVAGHLLDRCHRLRC